MVPSKTHSKKLLPQHLTVPRGLVVMGPGAGTISPGTAEAAEELYKAGIPTVVVARPVTGTGAPNIFPGSLYVYRYFNPSPDLYTCIRNDTETNSCEILQLTGRRFYSSYIGAEQARVMLQLAINAGYSMDEIRDLFEGPLRKAIYASANSGFYGLS